MNRNDHIDRLVDEALASLDGIQRAEPAPFFHTRLMARLEGGGVTGLDRFVGVVSRPAFAIATAVIFLLLNGFILAGLFKGRQSNAAEEPGQSLAYEYTHNAPNNSFYENNPDHP